MTAFPVFYRSNKYIRFQELIHIAVLTWALPSFALMCSYKQLEFQIELQLFAF